SSYLAGETARQERCRERGCTWKPCCRSGQSLERRKEGRRRAGSFLAAYCLLPSARRVSTFISTVAIIPFMPDGWAASAGGFPAMTGNVPFLMKDVVFLAVSVYLLKQDVVRASLPTAERHEWREDGGRARAAGQVAATDGKEEGGIRGV